MSAKTNCIGIDVGGTKIYGGRYDIKNWKEERCAKIQTKSDLGIAAVLVDITTMIGELRDENTVAVGIGLPGYVSHDEKVIYHIPNIKFDGPLNIAPYLESIKLPFCIENDVNLIAFAEARLNYQELANLIVVAMGTGVGGGLIIDRHIYRGARGFAGEFGHMLIGNNADGLPCSFESVCSGTGIEAITGINGKKLFLQARNGEAAAMKHLVDFGNNLGIGLSNLVQSFNPDVIVLGGAIGLHLDLYGEAMWESVKKYSKFEQYKDLEIVSTIVQNAGAVGAAMLSYECNIVKSNP